MLKITAFAILLLVMSSTAPQTLAQNAMLVVPPATPGKAYIATLPPPSSAAMPPFPIPATASTVQPATTQQKTPAK